MVTCDYLPDNYAHRFSDGYINASIIDKDAVLAAAREIGADGIMSFAADPGVTSAAYAAEKLGLPFQDLLSRYLSCRTRTVFEASCVRTDSTVRLLHRSHRGERRRRLRIIFRIQ